MVPCKRITGSGRSAELIAKEERISRTVDDEEGERNLLRIGRGKIFSYEINVIGIKRRAIINDFNEEFLLIEFLNLFFDKHKFDSTYWKYFLSLERLNPILFKK